MSKKAQPCASASSRATAVISRRNAEVYSLPTLDLHLEIERYLAVCSARQFSPRTIAAKNFYFHRLFEFLEDHELKQCGEAELLRFFAELRDKRTGELMRPVSVESFHRCYKTFFSWLVSDETLEVSPMRRVPAPRVLADQVQPLDMEQVRALLKAARVSQFNRRNTALVLLMIDTGLRVSEVCALRVGDIDLKGRALSIIGKGNRRRTVHYTPTTSVALWNHLRERRDGTKRADDEHSALPSPRRALFVALAGAYAGEPMTRSGIYQVIADLGRAAKIRGVRVSPHTLRHTFATEMIRNSAYQDTVQQLLGHSDPRMTQRYVTLAKADVQRQHTRCSPVAYLDKAAFGSET
jgi:site-specific recombinase XerD